jgi:GDP-mannose transporter
MVESDPLVWEKAKPFMLVAVAFLGALYTNVKTLQYANVETFIVFRSSTPILIALMVGTDG